MTIRDLGAPTDETFKNLNLIALRKYACPTADKKQNEWYLNCVACDQNLVCGAGKRVIEILDKKTKPVETKKLDLEKRFLEALKKDDPMGWLVEKGYYVNRHVAYNNFHKWKEKHPENKSINVVKIAKSNANHNKVRDLIIEIFDNQPKEAILLRYFEMGINPTCTIHSATQKLYYWASLCPDLNEKFHFTKNCRDCYKLELKYGKTAQIRDVIAEEFYNVDRGFAHLNEAKETNAMPEKEDEVSVEDLLNEMEEEPKETATDEKPKKTEVVRGVPIPETKIVIPNKVIERSETQNVLLDEFSKKRREIKSKLKIAEESLKKIQDHQARLQMQLTVLDDAAMIFGMKVKEDAQ